MHVRLIFPFVACIARLDTNRTATASGGKPGYDPSFNTPDVAIIDGRRVSAREERETVKIAAQIEDRTWEMLRAYDNGISPESNIGIVADYQSLRKAGHVDCQTGAVLFNVNDRLDRIEDKRGRLVTAVKNPPGLFCIEVRPLSYGIGSRLNLVLMLFEDRSRGANARG